MDLPAKLFLAAFLVLSAAIHGAYADAMVTGTVFCDQCKDGQRSPFDFPVNGAKVTVSCADSNGEITMSREETTNWFGSYALRFDGTPDLNGCYARVSGSGEGSMGCGQAAGHAQNLRLMFRMFDMEMYAVDPLLAQPAQPMSYCPKSSNPVPSPPPNSPNPVPSPPNSPNPVPSPPPNSPNPGPSPPNSPNPVPSPPTPPKSPPAFTLPPLPLMPPLPPLPPLPPTIFAEASACPHEKWTMPEYRCYWRVNRDTKVAVAFGMVAARRYGTDITLWNGLQGRGDPYKTLLREGITALLNSYNTLHFSYHPIAVITHMNMALMGSPRILLLTALRFKRANSGAGNVTCKFTSCN